MCRLIGYASREPREIAPYLTCLSILAQRGNPDGWGISYRSGDKTRIIRQVQSAEDDELIGTLKAKADRLIGHVRMATDKRTVNASNSHPFHVDGITLAHNGMFRGAIGAEADRRKVSDSLVFLEVLAERWTERTTDGLREALLSIVNNDDLVGEFSGANLIIGYGNSLYAFRCFRTSENYYSLFVRETENMATVSSVCLNESPEWRLLANKELVDLTR